MHILKLHLCVNERPKPMRLQKYQYRCKQPHGSCKTWLCYNQINCSSPIHVYKRWIFNCIRRLLTVIQDIGTASYEMPDMIGLFERTASCNIACRFNHGQQCSSLATTMMTYDGNLPKMVTLRWEWWYIQRIAAEVTVVAPAPYAASRALRIRSTPWKWLSFQYL